MVERWTQERRRQHTRDLLLDAAEQVFAERGFEGASLEEIAETAGYTRGAIYKHFGTKDQLFLAVNHRSNERFLQAFADVAEPATPLENLDLATIAERWHGLLSRDPRQYALSAEFNLYVLRNPDVRQRVAEQRRALAELIAAFIDDQAASFGESLRIPSLTLARIVLATSDGIELAGYLDGTDGDLHEPFLQLLVSAWGSTPLDPAPPPQPPTKKATQPTTSPRKRPSVSRVAGSSAAAGPEGPVD